MPDRIDKTVFIIGLTLYLAGQIWIVTTGSMTKDEVPMDYIHWLMFLGAALLIPFAARLPRRGLALIAGPAMITGSILIIGMCMIDFVLWSFPQPELRSAVVGELMNTGPVWKPFIDWAGRVFTVALALVGLCHWHHSKIGVGLVIIGAVVISAWGIGSNPYGYATMIVGFLVCFWPDALKRFTSAR